MTQDEQCRCGGTGTATAVIALADAVLLDDRACPAGCPPAITPELLAAQMSDYLTADERRLVTAGGDALKCGHCQDFRSRVTDGVPQPCPDCQPDLYEAWFATRKQEAAR